jgi:hypothetical protein
MAQTTQGEGRADADVRKTRESDGAGWLTFAGVLFLVAATFDAVYGISALVNDDYFAADELLFGDLSLWGVVFLGFAAVQALAGFMILARSSAGAVIGISLAMLHALTVVISIGAYPVWSVILLVIDGMVIYGLTVYGLPED